MVATGEVETPEEVEMEEEVMVTEEVMAAGAASVEVLAEAR